MARHWKKSGVVRDIDGDDALTLVCSEEGVTEVMQTLGYKGRRLENISDRFGCCYVETKDGDYGRILCSEQNVPRLNDELYEFYETSR